ncbi:MAG TPA: c-type cytochrome [Roseiarcus sp.]|nr:c-type cytochrome [Roseiarcus sp.]
MVLLTFALPFLLSAAKPEAANDASKGEQYFRACAACHSLTPDHNMTGPSLAGLFGRKAGTLASFPRYSPALQASGVIWNEQTLDAWLAGPTRFIPDSRMPFEGIEQPAIRSDLIAYLKKATAANDATSGPRVGMPGDPDLKNLQAENKVLSITYCPDTYRVTTADGQTQGFWERNLRFKTDSSPIGPDKGAPALFGAGMQGDRASIIFSSPEEISAFVKRQC